MPFSKLVLCFCVFAVAVNIGLSESDAMQQQTTYPSRLPVGGSQHVARVTPKSQMLNPISKTNDEAASAIPMGSSRETASSGIKDGNLHLPYCSVQLIQKIVVPALETGFLSKLNVRQGDSVAGTFILATVDQQAAATELDSAKMRLEASRIKIRSDVDIRYAKASFKSASEAYRRVLSLYNKNIVPAAEKEEAHLREIQTSLQIEKAQNDQVVNKKAIGIDEVNVRKMQERLKRHEVTAPWNGLVGKIEKHQGEWVNAGDTILELLQMERLWVEGKVSANQVNPYQLKNRAVTIHLKLAGQQPHLIKGRIVFVDSELSNTGKYIVRAEVPNQAHNDHWLLLPGGTVKMVIHIEKGGQ